jgi:hypothetical protein
LLREVLQTFDLEFTPLQRQVLRLLPGNTPSCRKMVRKIHSKLPPQPAESKARRIGFPIATALRALLRGKAHPARLYKGGTGMVKIGKTLGIGTGLVQRVVMEQPRPFDVAEAYTFQ